MTSPSPTPSPLSPEVSDNSAVSQTPPKPQIDSLSGAGGSNGVVDSQEKKPETVVMFKDTDSKEDIEKYKKLEADYTHYLNAKYFSNKDIFGGIIFDEKTAINNGTIKSSRWPGTRSYADPLQAFEEQTSNSPTSGPETPANTSNGKHTAKN
uniref:Uncharacterized protein n=1 Tax=Kalanchoe fedtschenkoi TaxID=63787 RepID=A0A7N0R863_KALFE